MIYQSWNRPRIIFRRLIRPCERAKLRIIGQFSPARRRRRFFSPENMTHAARSSTQASAVIVTFGKWVKARGAVNVFYRAKKKRRKHNATFIIISLQRDSFDRAHCMSRIVYVARYTRICNNRANGTVSTRAARYFVAFVAIYMTTRRFCSAASIDSRSRNYAAN